MHSLKYVNDLKIQANVSNEGKKFGFLLNENLK